MVRKMKAGKSCLEKLKSLGLLAGLLSLSLAAPVMAQSSLITSKAADYSSDDSEFTFQDTLYIKVDFPQADYLSLEKHEYELEAENDGKDEIEGELTNNLDGTYTQKVALSSLNRLYTTWVLEVKIEDEFGHKFKAKTELIIRTDEMQTGDEITISGKITYISDTVVQVASQEFQVNAQTQVWENQSELPYSRLRKGWSIKILAERLQTGQMLAKRIEVLSRQNDGDLELEARIYELDSEIINVGNAIFHLTDDVEVKDQKGDDTELDALRTGMLVKIEGERENGRLIAKDIRIKDLAYVGQEITVVGDVRHFTGSDTLRIRETSYLVDAASVFYGFDGQAFDPAGLRLGETVELKCLTQAEAPAKVLSLKRLRNFYADVVSGGKIVAITDTHFELNNALRFAYDDMTLVYDSTYNFLTLDALRTGREVEVYADEQHDGSLLARKVVLDDEAPETVVINDLISAIEDNALVVSNIRFIVTDETVVLDQAGRAFPFHALEIQNAVEITGEKIGDEYYATIIKLSGLGTNALIWTGVIEEMDGHALRVSDKDFSFSDSTYFIDENGDVVANAASRSSLFAPGEIVVVFSIRTAEGLYATRVELNNSVDEELVITGKVTGTSNGMVLIYDQKITLGETTEILDEAGLPLRAEDLVWGTPVHIRARLLDDNSAYAWRIQRHATDTDTIVVVGPLTHGAAGSLVKIDKLEFLPSKEVVIRGAGGQPIRLDEIREGTIVEIIADDFGQTLLATSIQVIDRVTLTGRLESFSATSVTVAGESFALADDLLVLDLNGRPADLSEARENYEIHIAADLGAGMATAQRLRVVRNDIPASVRLGDGIKGDSGRLPQVFTLSPSYPNPIVRSQLRAAGTRIQFTLEQPAQVTLRIFNVLGREVVTLYQRRAFDSGSYEVRWNGTDRLGRLVAPGVYFYQMRVENKVIAQRFVILR